MCLYLTRVQSTEFTFYGSCCITKIKCVSADITSQIEDNLNSFVQRMSPLVRLILRPLRLPSWLSVCSTCIRMSAHRKVMIDVTH